MQRQFNRRQFLGTASAAALATPFMVHSARARAGRKGPNDLITIGVIGTGTQGGGLTGNFLAMPDTQVVAVCDVDTTRREHHRKRVDEFYSVKGNKDYKGCAAYKEFSELLARKDIDAVVIAAPDHWHAYIAIAACKAGKDVYCQKPESLTIREGRAMVENARRYNRVVSGGSQRVMDDYRKTVEKCWSGKIGTPKEAFANPGMPSVQCCNLPGMPVPEGLDWDMWLGPAPMAPYHPYRMSDSWNIAGNVCWRSWRDYSGGSMTDWGAHYFGGVLFALNKMEEGPVEILPPDGKGRKYLTFKYADGTLRYHSLDHHVDVIGDGIPVAPREIPTYKGHGGIYGDFIECVKTREKPFRDIERAHRTISIAHLAVIAYDLNRPLKWDPVKEIFPGDPQANRFLDRAHREPWTI